MIVNVLSGPALGGTFLSWSLHYLSGDKSTYHTLSQTWKHISHNPITKLNAHNWAANHPANKDEFDDCFSKLLQEPPRTFHSLYMHNFNYQLGDTIDIELADAISKLQSVPDSKTIVIQLPMWHTLYHSKFEGRVLVKKYNTPEIINKTFVEQHEDFIDTFYSMDKAFWDLTVPWEKREFWALNSRPYETNGTTNITKMVALHKEHYMVNCVDLFTSFDNTLYTLFDFLNLPIDNNRKRQWLEVYTEWKGIHADRLLFVEYFEQIIQSIIHNYYMDLTRFNLDIIREADILHVLIYKYGLTIKGWGLEKFPSNTQDLHLLLEPNIYHKVEDIYQVIKT